MRQFLYCHEAAGAMRLAEPSSGPALNLMGPGRRELQRLCVRACMRVCLCPQSHNTDLLGVYSVSRITKLLCCHRTVINCTRQSAMQRVHREARNQERTNCLAIIQGRHRNNLAAQLGTSKPLSSCITDRDYRVAQHICPILYQRCTAKPFLGT